MKIRCRIPEKDNVVTVMNQKFRFVRDDISLVCDVQDREAAEAILRLGPEFYVDTGDEDVESQVTIKPAEQPKTTDALMQAWFEQRPKEEKKDPPRVRRYKEIERWWKEKQRAYVSKRGGPGATDAK